MTCEHFDSSTGYCESTEGVKVYLPGPRCPAHTPAAAAGRSDHRPDPETTLDVLRAKAGQTWSLQIQQHKGRNVR